MFKTFLKILKKKWIYSKCYVFLISQILIDSAIDLELPAYKTQGFVTYVYPIPEGPTFRIKVTIPIHVRYHEPSFEGETFTSVHIEPPDLLLRSEKCKWGFVQSF